jgi:hypothetical protein
MTDDAGLAHPGLVPQAMSLGLGKEWGKICKAYAAANRALGDIVKARHTHAAHAAFGSTQATPGSNIALTCRIAAVGSVLDRKLRRDLPVNLRDRKPTVATGMSASIIDRLYTHSVAM